MSDPQKKLEGAELGSALAIMSLAKLLEQQGSRGAIKGARQAAKDLGDEEAVKYLDIILARLW